jgi:phi LC3 family holin
MKINWKARFKNKAFLITFITLIVAFVYQVLGLFGVVPSISEDTVMNFFTIVINLMATLGVIVDPTTPGASDSERAMTYFTDADVRDIE